MEGNDNNFPLATTDSDGNPKRFVVQRLFAEEYLDLDHKQFFLKELQTGKVASRIMKDFNMSLRGITTPSAALSYVEMGVLELDATVDSEQFPFLKQADCWLHSRSL